MPEWTNLALMDDALPHVALSDEAIGFLEAHSTDEHQRSMMAEAVIEVDREDHILGPLSKVEAHRGSGRLHRAFSLLMFDSKGRLLLQQRASDKITFPGVWANTCCSHPLHVAAEMDPENGAKHAAIRKMEQELGVAPQAFEDITLHQITKMTYRARMDEHWVEEELDHLIIGVGDLEVDPNPNEVQSTRWVTEDDLNQMLEADSEDAVIAPWFRLIATEFLPRWWPTIRSGGDPATLADEMIHHLGDATHLLPAWAGPSLHEAMHEIRSSIEPRIERFLGASANDRLNGAMMHLIEGGGKRLRAVLPTLVARAIGSDADDGLLDLGAALETIHNFTLLHDDIMDDDEVRRGRPAVHVAFDVPTAINAGDAMLAIAFEMIASSPHIDDGHMRDLVLRIGQMVREVAEGQQMDMEFEQKDLVSEDEYLTMIERKTGTMFRAGAEMGALMSGASADLVEAMRRWGHALGICFQIMDDLIDLLSDSKSLGKPSGSDLKQGKRTLIALHALRQAPSEAKATFEIAFGNEASTDAMVADAVAALHTLGSIDHARSMAFAHHETCHAILDALKPSPNVRALRELTDMQISRMH